MSKQPSPTTNNEPSWQTSPSLRDGIFSGDPKRRVAAFVRYVNERAERMLAQVRGLLRATPAEAEDFLHDAIAKIHERIEGGCQPTPGFGFRQCIHKLVHDAVVDRIRSVDRRRKRETSWDQLSDSLGDSLEQQVADRGETESQVLDFLAQTMLEFVRKEILERAEATVQRRVSPSTWRAFELWRDDSGAEALTTRERVAAHRVRAQIDAEIDSIARAEGWDATDLDVR
ncbi:MAG: hypothetical protein NT069_19715 [Planctomycetota bacterium]|nr:hypothetical protein [Planctomycetota bacterium]